MFSYLPAHRFLLVTGHFGSGKTNVAVNLALNLRSRGYTVTIADLDIVNPYFRTADNVAELKAAGVRCIIPAFANSNVDIPSIPPEINTAFEDDSDYVILDIGGDDSGATALGMFASRLTAFGYDMLYVVNAYRPLTDTPEGALTILREIEAQSRLHCTGIVNNSNLGSATEADTLPATRAYAASLAAMAQIPQLFESSSLPVEDDILPVFLIRDITNHIYGGQS